MKKILLAATLFMASHIAIASEKSNEKISLMLDWFVNPDHATLVVAQQKGFFKKHGIEVELIEPADPSMPSKLVSANKVDMAISSQPYLHLHVSEGLPLARIGTLASSPLVCLVTLKDSGITSLADLKGKTIGYSADSVNGLNENLLTAMLHSVGIKPDELTWINVNWSLSPSLISGKVDAVFGAFRNFELNVLSLENQKAIAFYPEEHGVPAFDELIFVVNKDRLSEKKFDLFLTALEEATVYTLNHPEEAWNAFTSYKPKELDNELNRLAWRDTLPYLALRPRALDINRYQRMSEFLQKYNMVKTAPTLSEYAVELPIK